MRYETSKAFRVALEGRLKVAMQGGGRPIGSARKLVAFDRLWRGLSGIRLARRGSRWVLRGYRRGASKTPFRCERRPFDYCASRQLAEG